MEVFNSPLFVLLIFVIVAAVIWYKKASGADRKCGSCKIGIMEEVAAKPEGLVGGTAADTTSKPSVKFTVTYKCSNCKETYTRTETRD
jgi:hypothetical protein